MRKAGPANVSSLIQWAETKKIPVDVFIVLSNYTVGTKNTRNAILQYRTQMKLPNTK